MKQWIGVLMMVALALPLCSCKKTGEREQYDSRVDSPVSIVNVDVDNGMTADQQKVSSDYSRAGTVQTPSTPSSTPSSGPTTTTAPSTGPTTSPGPTTQPEKPITPTTTPATTPTTTPVTPTTKPVTPATTPSTPVTPTTKPDPPSTPHTGPATPATPKDASQNITEVKQALTGLLKAAKDNPGTVPAALMTDDLAALMNTMNVVAPKQLSRKAEQVKVLAKGNDFPAFPYFSRMTKAHNVANMYCTRIYDFDLQAATFEDTPDGVMVTPPQGGKLFFAKISGGWKMAIPPLAKELFTKMTGLYAAQDKFLDSMLAGIKDGSINKANYAQKCEEFRKQSIESITVKFAGALPFRPEVSRKPATNGPNAKAISQLNQVIGAIQRAVAGNRAEMPAIYLTTDMGGAVKNLSAQAKPIPPKIAKLLDAMKAKGIEPPDGFIKDLDTTGNPGDTDMWANLDFVGITYAQAPKGIFVISDGGVKMFFATTPAGWKLAMPPEGLGAVTQLCKVQLLLDNALTAGVEDGSITKDNFQEKYKQLGAEAAGLIAKVTGG